MKRIFNDKTLKDKRRKLRNYMPEPERRLWYCLKNRQLYGIKFRRQCSVGPYMLDFYSFEFNLCIGVGGDSHFESVKARNYDFNRTNYSFSQGINVIRFSNKDIMQNIDSCLLRIRREINELERKNNPI